MRQLKLLSIIAEALLFAASARAAEPARPELGRAELKDTSGKNVGRAAPPSSSTVGSTTTRPTPPATPGIASPAVSSRGSSALALNRTGRSISADG
jgi:hypothetical protein